MKKMEHIPCNILCWFPNASFWGYLDCNRCVRSVCGLCSACLLYTRGGVWLCNELVSKNASKMGFKIFLAQFFLNFVPKIGPGFVN